MMHDEAEQLYNDEVLNTRRELQESSTNLEQLAKYCEQSFLTCQDQQVYSIRCLKGSRGWGYNLEFSKFDIFTSEA